VDKKAFNPFEMAQAQFDKVADIITSMRPPVNCCGTRSASTPSRFRADGRRSVKVFRGFRVQHNDAAGRQGRHPLPPARDARHGAGAGDLDDVEVLGGGYPAGRRQGRRHLRPHN